MAAEQSSLDVVAAWGKQRVSVLKWTHVRNHWRDTLWLWRDLQEALIPLLDLAYTVAYWQGITEALAKPPRKRSSMSAEWSQQN